MEAGYTAAGGEAPAGEMVYRATWSPRDGAVPDGMGQSPMGPSRGGGIFPDGKDLSPMGLARQRS